MSYSNDRQWSDQFIPFIRSVVGPRLLVPSSFDVDTKQAADLIVLRARDMMIAARVRRHGYFDRYPYDFTIRSKRDSGAETELRKMIDGFGDWMFYGHAYEHIHQVRQWMLIDLHVWRAALLRAGYRDNGGWSRLSKEISNGDGTYFMAFDVRKFPAEMVIAKSSHYDVQEAA